ncbi:hypothetical protein M413DRAFT_130967 [Hebeloma cylindrosporum]|uniref:Uncharacterized protein n=1 Tax=Hebeloma cylindrosporum TaxID=76867 RepID=A0A0C3C0B0_HEBCY|nr:hypothetical protein M413DRAFT_130967 [Hebeloma cylindrosporum h7]
MQIALAVVLDSSFCPLWIPSSLPPAVTGASLFFINMRRYISFWFFNLIVALFIPIILGSRFADRRFSISEPRTTLRTTRFWLPEPPLPPKDSLKRAVSKIFRGRRMEVIGRWFRFPHIWKDEPAPLRERASRLRMSEDSTFISIRELPLSTAHALEGGLHRRSESFDEEEVRSQRMSGDR